MQKLCLFNPDHDLALANWDASYMSPASARKMADDLALLPVWYAEEGTSVLAPSAYNLVFLKEMQQLFPLQVSLMTEAEDFSGIKSVVPWGWNISLRKKLLNLGIAEEVLPSLDGLERLRQLSHRSQAMELLPRLQLDASFCGESVYLQDMEQCRLFVENKDCCLLKAPWSGSGKGLNWCKGAFTLQIAGWCARLIDGQGGVIGEPIYNKVEDFAMEFCSDGQGQVRFVGYSVFRATESGAYDGNRLITDEEVERCLSMYVPLSALRRLQHRLTEELSSQYGTSYEGYLGVDMMIVKTGAGYAIHPCVEVNLRMNMGVVARLLYDRFVAPAHTGFFQILYYSKDGDALCEHEKMKADRPLELEGGRVSSGYLPLVPVHKRSRYVARMVIALFP